MINISSTFSSNNSSSCRLNEEAVTSPGLLENVNSMQNNKETQTDAWEDVENPLRIENLQKRVEKLELQSKNRTYSKNRVHQALRQKHKIMRRQLLEQFEISKALENGNKLLQQEINDQQLKTQKIEISKKEAMDRQKIMSKQLLEQFQISKALKNKNKLLQQKISDQQLKTQKIETSKEEAIDRQNAQQEECKKLIKYYIFYKRDHERIIEGFKQKSEKIVANEGEKNKIIEKYLVLGKLSEETRLELKLIIEYCEEGEQALGELIENITTDEWPLAASQEDCMMLTLERIEPEIQGRKALIQEIETYKEAYNTLIEKIEEDQKKFEGLVRDVTAEIPKIKNLRAQEIQLVATKVKTIETENEEDITPYSVSI